MQSRKIILNAAGVVLFLAAGAAAMFLTRPSPSKPEAPQQPVATQAPTPTPAPTPPEPAPAKPATWYVYVTGAVNTPGVYPLPEDSRIFHAIDSAGGFTSRADRAAINLAEPLMDGAHVHVPARGENAAAQPAKAPAQAPAPSQPKSGIYISGTTSKTASTKSTGGAAMVDVNHASAKELEQLTGVGPAISKRIVEYRQSHGKFNSPEDLINVKGIGAAKLEKMRSQILIR